MSNVQQLVEELTVAWNAHDADKVQSFYAPDCEEMDVALREPQCGSDRIRKLMNYYLRAFPDVQVTVDEIICEGDRAALSWTWCGTHRGRFMNIPPTHRHVTVHGATFVTLRHGLIHRVKRVWDVAGLLRALGLLPEL
jgi:steroid delta-isomerase-like uncharacterized protein